MKCKKCGIDLTGMEYKKVAEWPFCLKCFRTLIDRGGEEKRGKTEETKGANQEPLHKTEPASLRQRCRLCEKEVEKGRGRKMLGLLFCPECYEDLVKMPAVTPPAKEDEEGSEVKPLVAQVRVDLRRTVQCRACGRQIPVMGSREFEGHPYCPDCYVRLPGIKAQKPESFPPASEASGGDKNQDVSSGMKTGLKCQACGREALSENLKTVEGFEICTACLSTDPDMALEIAHARHRRALEEMKKELDASESGLE